MVLEKFSLKGQTAVVTGGGQGLGKVFCHAFADAGADIVVAEINEETGPETIKEIERKGRKALFIRTDITDSDHVVGMVKQTIDEFGKIDILMNNAGIVDWGEAESVKKDDWLKVMDVNVNG